MSIRCGTIQFDEYLSKTIAKNEPACSSSVDKLMLEDLLHPWNIFAAVVMLFVSSLVILGSRFIRAGQNVKNINPRTPNRELIGGPPVIKRGIGYLLIAIPLLPFVMEGEMGARISLAIIILLSIALCIYVLAFWILKFTVPTRKTQPAPHLVIIGTMVLLLALVITLAVGIKHYAQ